MKKTAQLFKVLADEARLRMLWLLFHERELCVCDIMDILGITQSKASRHLRILHNAGLVTDRREGLWGYYSLSHVADPSIQAHLKTLRKTMGGREDAADLLIRLSSRVKGNDCASRCGQKQISRSHRG